IQTMIKKLIALTILSTISASPLQASEDFDGKTYFYGGIGKADVNFDHDAVEYIGEDTLFTLGVGRELNKFLSVEAETNHVFENAVEHEAHFWNATLGLKADYDFNQNIAAFVKGGIAFNYMDAEMCDRFGCFKTNGSSQNFTYSVGLELTND
uniref:outer membrane beta-barrel protein n=1 Tax=Photobacterium sanctipauli TaxID=1342794 RepID=UPI00056A774E